MLAGCGFSAPGGAVDADPPRDADADAEVVDGSPAGAAVPGCPAGDPMLRVCFGFDESPLPPQLPSVGTASVTANLVGVTREARSPTRGAARLDAASAITMTAGTGVTAVLTSEVWVRLDTLPVVEGDAGRVGLFDSNTFPNLSLFLYRASGGGTTLRCGLGGQTEVFPAVLAADVWHYLACVCELGAMTVYVDGAAVGPARPGSCTSGGSFAADGFTIGSDNSGGGTAAGARLVGAVDAVRLWAEPRTAAAIAQSARDSP